MKPGAVAIWPTSNGLREVAPIDRLTWGRNVLTVVLKNRCRLVVRVRGDTLSTLEQHQHEMRFIRFEDPPTLEIG